MPFASEKADARRPILRLQSPDDPWHGEAKPEIPPLPENESQIIALLKKVCDDVAARLTLNGITTSGEVRKWLEDIGIPSLPNFPAREYALAFLLKKNRLDCSQKERETAEAAYKKANIKFEKAISNSDTKIQDQDRLQILLSIALHLELALRLDDLHRLQPLASHIDQGYQIAYNHSSSSLGLKASSKNVLYRLHYFAGKENKANESIAAVIKNLCGEGSGDITKLLQKDVDQEIQAAQGLAEKNRGEKKKMAKALEAQKSFYPKRKGLDWKNGLREALTREHKLLWQNLLLLRQVVEKSKPRFENPVPRSEVEEEAILTDLQRVGDYELLESAKRASGQLNYIQLARTKAGDLVKLKGGQTKHGGGSFYARPLEGEHLDMSASELAAQVGGIPVEMMPQNNELVYQLSQVLLPGIVPPTVTFTRVQTDNQGVEIPINEASQLWKGKPSNESESGLIKMPQEKQFAPGQYPLAFMMMHLFRSIDIDNIFCDPDTGAFVMPDNDVILVGDLEEKLRQYAGNPNIVVRGSFLYAANNPFLQNPPYGKELTWDDKGKIEAWDENTFQTVIGIFQKFGKHVPQEHVQHFINRLKIYREILLTFGYFPVIYYSERGERKILDYLALGFFINPSQDLVAWVKRTVNEQEQERTKRAA